MKQWWREADSWMKVVMLEHSMHKILLLLPTLYIVVPKIKIFKIVSSSQETPIHITRT